MARTLTPDCANIFLIFLRFSKLSTAGARREVQRGFSPHQTEKLEIADLRAFSQQKLEQMLRQNATRVDFGQRLQGIIDAGVQEFRTD